MKKTAWMTKIGLSVGALALATSILPTGTSFGVEAVEASPLTASAVKSFPDVKEYKAEIEFLTGKGIINGHSDGTFHPKENLKRVHAVEMVLREMGIKNFNAPNPGFVDLKRGQYGYEAVSKAVELGFINGEVRKGKKYFDPNGTLTRGEMAKILTEAYKLSQDKNIQFKDVSAKHWTKPYVSRLATAGVTNGYPGNTFKPDENIERQHFAVFMARLLNDEFIPEPVPATPAPTPTPTPTPTPAPAPVKPAKDAFISITAAERHLFSAISPQDRYSKLYIKPTSTLFTATLLPSTDEDLSARYGVTYVWKDSKKFFRLKVNSQRYRDNAHLQGNGKVAIQYATEAVFGRGNAGTKQLQDFIYANMNGKSDFEKTMTFGGNEAFVRVGEWDIDITFK